MQCRGNTRLVPDLIIRNGKIVDGTGGPWFKADVSVRDGRIEGILPTIEGQADQTVDARGFVVCPGFIDTHTHSDGTILVDPGADSSIRQGVTTQIIGNCGCGFAPVNPVRRSMIEGYIRRLLPLDVKSDWMTFREYMSKMGRLRFSTNIAPLVSHGAVRIAVMGFEERRPTAEELGLMRLLVSEAMEAGAFGMSTGLIYPPCVYAQTEEISELCRVVAEHYGLFTIHMRGEGDTLIQSVIEAITIGKEAGVRTHISHLKAAGRTNWGKTREALWMLEEAREGGLEVTFDQYPYTAGATPIVTLLPPWAHEGGLDKLLMRLRDPKIRDKMRIEMGEPGRGWENMAFSNGWENIFVTVLRSERSRAYEGKSMAEIREMRNDPDEFTTLCDVLLEEGGEGRINVFSQDEGEMKSVMGHRLQMVGSDGRSVAPHGPLSVGKPHPRFYGTFPRILGRYVRLEGVLRLEDAVRRMTSYPAQTFRIDNKGLIREGFDADLVVFDPDTVLDRSTYQEPHQYPVGIEYVIVNGEVVVEKGRHTGAAPGKFLSLRNKMR